ncbi:unnamed protein product [Symbiodinium natans]|uniref:Uncharacterized protein n=1 Tax=Symbiodinium natans TaxID=878477 RepID=A0A812G1Y3_9DINO|nr:unnamed protein product [Symbiodinium natans]
MAYRILGGLLLLLLAGLFISIDWVTYSGVAAGLFLGVVHVPGDAGRHFAFRFKLAKLAVCTTIALFSAYVATYPWLLIPALGPGVPNLPRRWVYLVALAMLSATWIACILSKHPHSTCANDAQWCVLGFWLLAVLSQITQASGAYHLGNVFLFFEGVESSLESVLLGWAVYFFQNRVDEISSQHVFTACPHLWIAAVGFSAVSFGAGLHDSYAVGAFALALFIGMYLAYTFTICMILLRSLCRVLGEARRVRGPPRKQANWAGRVLFVELLIWATLGTISCFAWLPCDIFLFQLMLHPELHEPGHFKNVKIMSISSWARCSVWVVNCLGLAALSGILWQEQPPAEEEMSEMSSRARARSLVSASSHLSSDEQEVYHEVVGQLANRGFRLNSLLDFWEQLLDEDGMMRSFEPRRSSTNDVVRLAIIPQSRSGDGGCALASLWSEDPIKPQVMVTHNWANGFGKLVAAILADCLDHRIYQDVGSLIVTEAGFAQVRAQLANKLDTSYWVCAFSVNQHASICAGFGPEPPPKSRAWKEWNMKRHDSVTGKVYPLCDCNVEKHVSHGDARCELNKFDDMMTHLATEVANFRQLVVLDDTFDVLFRAWCVAEIFEASALQMQATIQVSSQEAVDLNYDRLTLLDVRHCSASSEADKDMILSKIADVEAFNLHLQELVFSAEVGLFAEWVDGYTRSRQVGRILRRSKIGLQSSGSSLPNREENLGFCQGCLWPFSKSLADSSGESSDELSSSTADSAASPC